MKIFGMSILAMALVFLVGYFVAKMYPNIFSSIPVLNSIGSS